MYQIHFKYTTPDFKVFEGWVCSVDENRIGVTYATEDLEEAVSKLNRLRFDNPNKTYTLWHMEGSVVN